MAQKEYGCNSCKVIFSNPEPSISDGKGDARCPYCQGSDVQNLDNPKNRFDFLRQAFTMRFG